VKRAALISLIVGAALAIVPAAFAAELSDAGGGTVTSQTQAVTMAPTSYQDALRTYGSTSSTSSKVTPMSQLDPAIQAVLLRNRATQSVPLTGKALADYYDTGAVVTSQPTETGAFVGQPDILGGNGGTSTTSATSSGSSSIDWNAAIPAILLTGLLLAAAATVVTRRRHQHQLSV